MTKNKNRNAVIAWVQAKGFAYLFKADGDHRDCLWIIMVDDEFILHYSQHKVPVEVVDLGLDAVKNHLRTKIRNEMMKDIEENEARLQRQRAELATCTNFLD